VSIANDQLMRLITRASPPSRYQRRTSHLLPTASGDLAGHRS
jgi:hypothetical protein